MSDNTPLCVVGIGASAGGIEAFRQFFVEMPADSGVALIVVLHLAPNRKSMLTEILARWTEMAVTEASDGQAVVANQVLVVPGGTVAKYLDGHLFLHRTPLASARETAPIDALFDSLAASLNEDAIGVVLSGTGHDGTLGLKAIRARGGLTLAQGENGTAPEYAGMPESAVAADAVDLHVPVEQMAGHILAARKVRLAAARAAAQTTPDVERIRLAICDILRSRLGHDFSQYKQQTFMRRVLRRMQVLRLSTYDDYLDRITNDREQVLALFRDLLINVTSFFRDAATFEALKKTIIPRLFQDKDATGDLRIWVPGCATGEEAYSLAMLFREHMDTLSTLPKVQILASDIDEVAVATARAGRFPLTLLEGLSAERRSRFFAESPGGAVVRQEIRDLCTFSVHSLVRDPPFSRIDLISCRNLLIYMNNDLQDRIIPIFHYALPPGGILILGVSETVARHERLFEPRERSTRIFVRRDGPAEMPQLYQLPIDSRRSGKGATLASDPKAHWQRAVEFASKRVLDRYAAPFVVVTAFGDVALFSSHTGRFLEPARGAPSSNLFDMARQGWGLELRAALRRCVETGQPVEQFRSIVTADGSLVLRVVHSAGYNRFSLTRASAVVNCQSALTCFLLRLPSHAATSSVRVCLSAIRRSRH